MGHVHLSVTALRDVLGIPFTDILSICCSLSSKEEVCGPYKTTGKIMVLNITCNDIIAVLYLNISMSQLQFKFSGDGV